MFDFITDPAVADFIFCAVVAWMIIRLANRIDPDVQELQEKLSTLEDTKLELEHINGVYYLWVIIPDEGHKFVGQSNDKEELAKRGAEYLTKKFMPS